MWESIKGKCSISGKTLSFAKLFVLKNDTAITARDVLLTVKYLVSNKIKGHTYKNYKTKNSSNEISVENNLNMWFSR